VGDPDVFDPCERPAVFTGAAVRPSESRSLRQGDTGRVPRTRPRFTIAATLRVPPYRTRRVALAEPARLKGVGELRDAPSRIRHAPARRSHSLFFERRVQDVADPAPLDCGAVARSPLRLGEPPLLAATIPPARIAQPAANAIRERHPAPPTEVRRAPGANAMLPRHARAARAVPNAPVCSAFRVAGVPLEWVAWRVLGVGRHRRA
jgi:hypothetical protein